MTQRKCTFVIGSFVGFKNDGEVWLSQIRIWHSVLISGSTELNWITWMGKKCSVLPLLSNLLHIWHDIKLSLYIFSTLSWVHVSMMSTYWLFLMVSWSACEWQKQHMVNILFMLLVGFRYEYGLAILMKHTNVWAESNRWISQQCCYNIISFRL